MYILRTTHVPPQRLLNVSDVGHQERGDVQTVCTEPDCYCAAECEFAVYFVLAVFEVVAYGVELVTAGAVFSQCLVGEGHFDQRLEGKGHICESIGDEVRLLYSGGAGHCGLCFRSCLYNCRLCAVKF